MRDDPVVLELALETAECAWKSDERRRDILSVIDYSLPSVTPRLWVFDMDSKTLIYQELLAPRTPMVSAEVFARP